MSARRALGWALLGAGLALSAMVLVGSWDTLLSPWITESRDVLYDNGRTWRREFCWQFGGCKPIYFAGVLLGGAGVVGLGAVAIAHAYHGWRQREDHL